MLHTSVQAMLLGWHSRSIGKRRKKAWNVAPLCFELLDQELKFSLLCNFLEWTKGGLRQESFSMIDFIDWLDCQ